jgi:hypothetical protein
MRSPAWLLSGLTGSVAGELELTRGRFIFETRDGRRIIDAPLGELTAVTFPWCYFDGGMRVRIGAETDRLSFARLANLPDHSGEAADAGDIRSARRFGAVWKSALAAVITRR